MTGSLRFPLPSMSSSKVALMITYRIFDGDDKVKRLDGDFEGRNLLDKTRPRDCALPPQRVRRTQNEYAVRSLFNSMDSGERDRGE